MPKDEKGREIQSRFYIDEGTVEFFDSGPVTPEEAAEAEAMWKP